MAHDEFPLLLALPQRHPLPHTPVPQAHCSPAPLIRLLRLDRLPVRLPPLRYRFIHQSRPPLHRQLWRPFEESADCLDFVLHAYLLHKVIENVLRKAPYLFAHRANQRLPLLRCRLSQLTHHHRCPALDLDHPASSRPLPRSLPLVAPAPTTDHR